MRTRESSTSSTRCSRLTALDVVPQSQFEIPSIEEDGESFVENAIIKARHAARLSGLAAIADDSGLMVDALDGAPGIYSARYAGEGASDSENLELLLHNMRDIPDPRRGAPLRVLGGLHERSAGSLPRGVRRHLVRAFNPRAEGRRGLWLRSGVLPE